MVTFPQGKTGILYIHPWSGFYGTDQDLYFLIKYFDRETIRPVVALPDKGLLWNRLLELDVPLSMSPIERWYTSHHSRGDALRWLTGFPQRVQRLVDIIHRWNIKIVHTNDVNVLDGAIAAKLTNRPHICTVRCNLSLLTMREKFISTESALEVLNSLSHMFVPVSHSVKDSLSPFVPPTKLHVIYDAVETESFQPAADNSSHNAVIAQSEKPDEPRICSFGRVSVEKGFELLIDAAALVVKSYPGARFSIFGFVQDEGYYQRLLQQVDQLDLAESFRFKGHTDLVPEKLYACDLFVHSSKSEGLSRVVLEAMAAGKPVVSTRSGGPEELIVEGTTGYLVPPNDSRALAEAILKMLKNPEHARQMGRKGLERVRHHFDPRHTSEQYEALYREVLEGGAARPTEDSNGEAVLVGVLWEILEKYGEEFYEMGSRYRYLKNFEERVKKTLAYKAYKAMKNLAVKLK